MCLVIARWNDGQGELASEGRMMAHLAAPVAHGPIPMRVAADDCFKVHRLGPSLIAGIVGWSHVADELLEFLRTLTAYEPESVTPHVVRLLQKHPGAALQAVLMGVKDGKVQAAAWFDAAPSGYFSPQFPANGRVLVLGNNDISAEAAAMARRGGPLKDIFTVLALKFNTINSNVKLERIQRD